MGDEGCASKDYELPDHRESCLASRGVNVGTGLIVLHRLRHTPFDLAFLASSSAAQIWLRHHITSCPSSDTDGGVAIVEPAADFSHTLSSIRAVHYAEVGGHI